jgi:uncharacterized protein (TIGR03435 family)
MYDIGMGKLPPNLVITAALMGAAVWSVFGQPSEALPHFEVASVKPNSSPSLRHVLIPPKGGRFSTRGASLRLLIQNAYNVESFEVSGGPDWMNTVGFDIEAKAEGSPNRAQMRLMLRSLLEDRFKLTVHRQMKDLPIYALTAGKSGFKLPAPEEKECTDAKDQMAGPCGDVVLTFEASSGLAVKGRHVTMADLAKILSTILGRRVIDRSEATEKFDVNLPFAYDDATTGIARPPLASSLNEAPSIFDSLQRQLGLRLQSTKGPVEVIVVDNAERPSEN